MDDRTVRKMHRLLSDFAKGKNARGADIASLRYDGRSDGWRLPPSFPEPDLRFSSVINGYPSIATELKERALFATAALFGGMLTLPELQGNSFRLQMLAHLAVLLCSGPRQPKIAQVSPWFDIFDRGPVGSHEDPAEDLFIELVDDNTGNYRIFGGTSEGNGFIIRVFLEMLETSSWSEARSLLVPIRRR